MSGKSKLFAAFILILVISSPTYAHLKIGTVYFDPPYVMSNQTGFDIRFVRLLCQHLKQSYSLMPMDYNALFKAVATGKVDLAIGGISIGAGGVNFIYSIPYALSKGQFMVKGNYETIDDLTGKKVGLIRGSHDGGVYYNFLESAYPNKFVLVQYDDTDDLITALNYNYIAAGFTHRSSVAYWTAHSGGHFKPLGKPMLVGSGIGIMASPNNVILMNEIDQQILTITESPEYLNLYNTYFGDE